jgi:hypothetical protein
MEGVNRMSNEQYAFIEKAMVPSLESWQRAINETGIDLALYDKLKPFEDSGFSPCKLFGKESGFEITYAPAQEVLDGTGISQSVSGGKNYCISFRWGGDMRECACVMAACYALANRFGARISYEGEEPYASTAALLKDLLAIVADAKNDS